MKLTSKMYVTRKASLLAGFAVGLAAAVAATLVMPRPPRLDGTQSADATLAADVRAATPDGSGYRGLSVARVEGGRITTATLGDTAGGPLFEIGSIAKTFTGMLLADLVADGTVRRDEPVRALLPQVRFDDPRVGDITLEELASHRSGLPRLARGGLPRAVLVGLSRANPYGQGVQEVLASASTASVGAGRGEVSYSNFGMALLGHALAARAGKPYIELVEQRILRPLGMTRTVLVVGDTALAGLAAGTTASGRPVEAWSGEGYAPAGVGPRATAADLGRLLAGMLAGSAPGADAATPRWDSTGSRRIGYAWFTEAYGDRTITWHSGGTGGFSSFVGFDRASGRGIAVLGNTDRSVDGIGLRLLGATAPAGAGSRLPTLLTWAGLGAIGYGLPLLAVTRRGHSRWWRSAPDRLRVADTSVTAVVVLLALHQLGAWLAVPPALWVGAVAGAAAGAAVLTLRWRDLPTVEGGSARARWAGLGFSVAVNLVLLAAVTGHL